MNAFSIGHKILGTLLFSACVFVATDSLAHRNHGGWRHHHGWNQGWEGRVYIEPSYYSVPYYNNCGWVGGHWRHGYWVPAHRVCWY
ncbi:MAG: hypothetical protein H0U57_11390 [Tatlockia sp.]|nr:hypothetical protein [Tatlockia sp.]